MKKNDEHICMECQYMTYDVLANARCAYMEGVQQTPIVSEYLPACHRFKGK